MGGRTGRTINRNLGKPAWIVVYLSDNSVYCEPFFMRRFGVPIVRF